MLTENQYKLLLSKLRDVRSLGKSQVKTVETINMKTQDVSFIKCNDSLVIKLEHHVKLFLDVFKDYFTKVEEIETELGVKLYLHNQLKPLPKLETQEQLNDY